MIRVSDEALEMCGKRISGYLGIDWGSLPEKATYIQRKSCVNPFPDKDEFKEMIKACLEEYELWKGRKSRDKQSRAAVLPSDWIMPEQWLKDAEDKLRSFSLPPINLLIEAEKFTNWGKQNPKKNWHLTWINWILPKDTVKIHRPPPSSFRSLPETLTEQRVRTSRELTDLIARKIEDEGVDRLDNTGNSSRNANSVSSTKNNQWAIGSRIEGTGSDLFEVALPGNRGNQQG